MRISFVRTGDRRYAVTIERAEATDLRMDPAPGFDPLLPHDLVHFVVETEFGLRDAIFGQIAAGGNGWTFVPTQEQRTRAWARKVARRNEATGTQMERSEELAAIVFPAWLRRHGHTPERSARPQHLPTDPPAADLPRDALERAYARLDDLSQQWRSLPIGAQLHVEWPWPERPARRHAS